MASANLVPQMNFPAKWNQKDVDFAHSFYRKLASGLTILKDRSFQSIVKKWINYKTSYFFQCMKTTTMVWRRWNWSVFVLASKTWNMSSCLSLKNLFGKGSSINDVTILERRFCDDTKYDFKQVSFIIIWPINTPLISFTKCPNIR